MDPIAAALGLSSEDLTFSDATEEFRARVIAAAMKGAANAEKKYVSDPNYRKRMDARGKPKRKKLDNPEGRIQGEILEYLNKRGIWAWRVSREGRFVQDGKGGLFRVKSLLPEGHSDIAGILPGGKACFIEVKAPGKKPRPDQLEFIERVKAKGGVAFWADSLDAVMDNLNKEV